MLKFFIDFFFVENNHYFDANYLKSQSRLDFDDLDLEDVLKLFEPLKLTKRFKLLPLFLLLFDFSLFLIFAVCSAGSTVVNS